MSGQAKWWWLGYFGVQTWTVEERRVRMTLFLTVFINLIVGLFVVGPLLEWFRFDPHAAAPLALLLSIVPAFYSARPIGSEALSQSLEKCGSKCRQALVEKSHLKQISTKAAV